jgi:hypothetical protein
MFLKFGEFELENKHLFFIENFCFFDGYELVSLLFFWIERIYGSIFFAVFFHDIDEDEIFFGFLIESHEKRVDIVDDIDEPSVFIFTLFSYIVPLGFADGLELITEDLEVIDISFFFEVFVRLARIIEKSIERFFIEGEKIIEYVAEYIGSHKK